jgi:hypothetical protein
MWHEQEASRHETDKLASCRAARLFFLACIRFSCVPLVRGAWLCYSEHNRSIND